MDSYSVERLLAQVQFGKFEIKTQRFWTLHILMTIKARSFCYTVHSQYVKVKMPEMVVA